MSTLVATEAKVAHATKVTPKELLIPKLRRSRYRVRTGL